MRIARYAAEGEVGFAVLEGGDELAVVDTHPFGTITLTGKRLRLGEVRLLAPILPTKVVAVGKNYADHAREMGGEAPESPVIFLKPSTAVCGPGDPIALPAGAGRVDFEGELAVVMGRLARDVPREKACDHVLGYTCANDVTARDQQKADGQWARAKGYDSFCPLGPWIETDLDPADLRLTTEVDGEAKQDARTSAMVHDVASLVSFVSGVMTLLPGDVILTGTPAGVGPLAPGSVVTVSVEGIGPLRNKVVERG